MKRFISGLLAIVILSVLVIGTAGCGTSNKNNTEDTQQTTQQGTQQAEAKPVKLTFKNYFVQGSNAEAPALAYRQTMDKFLAENKNITLDEEVLAHDSYEQKMMVESAASNLPDLFQLKANWIPTFNDNGLIGDMTEFMNNDPDWAAGFQEGSMDEFKLEGVTYGIPYIIATVSNLFYNKAIFEEIGYKEFPKDMAELDEAIKTLREKGYIPITAGNMEGWFIDVCFFRSFVDRYAGPEWNRSMMNKAGAKFTDPEFVAALNHMKKYVEMDAFNEDINSLDYIQGRSHFYNGKAAMLFDGNGGILPYTQEAPKEILDNMEVVPMPKLEGGKSDGLPGTAGWSIGYSAKADKEKLPAIEKILKVVGSSDFANIIAENSGTPAYKTTDYDKSKLPELMNKYNEMITNVPVTFMASFSPAVNEVMYTGLQEILIGKTTPEALAQKLQAAYEAE